MSDEINQPLDANQAATAYEEALTRSLEELRNEVDARLSASRDDLRRLIGDFEQSLPAPPQPEPPPPVEIASEPAAGEGVSLEELTSSLSEIEGADSQPELLARLVEQASLFASRTLLLLPAPGGTLRCWASLGFGGAGTMLENLDLTRPESPAWSGFQHGARELDSEHCRSLSDAVSVDPPSRGALVPLELRGQVLAVLYADQLGEDRFSVPALQLLTYGAARGLDTLGSGAPSVPAALRLADLATIASEGLTGETEKIVQAPVPVPPAAPEPPAPELPETGIPEVEVAQAEIPEPPPPEPPAVEPPAVEPIVASPDMETMPPVAEDAATTEIPSAEPIVPPPPDELYGGGDALEDDLESARAAGFTMEGESAAAPPSEPNFHVVNAPAVLHPESEAGTPPASPMPSAPIPESDTLPPTEELTSSQLPDFGTRETPAPPPSEPPPPIPAAPATPADDAWELAPEEPDEVAAGPPAAVAPPDVAAGPPAAVAPPDVAAGPPADVAPPTAAEPAEALATQVIHHDQVEAMVNATKAPPAAPPAPSTGGQVAPPADLQGPGSAFADRPAPDDPAHDEAQRLARLLVSEIKLYNEEAIEEGRREGNIYARLREDIDRSQHMYEERVDATVRATSDYFKDELIRTLASGDAAVMGL